MEGPRLRLRGLHHVTLICADVERSLDFYRDVLGLRLVKQTVNSDDRTARHLFFGDESGRPGTMITCLEYPELDEGTVGVGSTHHVALSVGTRGGAQGLGGLPRDRGVECTEVLDRTYFRSIYLRDPDGHIVELATRGARRHGGRAAGAARPPPRLGGGQLVGGRSGGRGREYSFRPRPRSRLRRSPGWCRRPRPARSSGEHRRQRDALAVGEGADLLVLRALPPT